VSAHETKHKGLSKSLRGEEKNLAPYLSHEEKMDGTNKNKKTAVPMTAGGRVGPMRKNK